MKNRDKTCKAPDCVSPVLAKDMCNLHYHRFAKHGSFDLPVKEKKICAIYSCGKEVRCSFLCEVHYKRLQSRGTTSPRMIPCEICGNRFEAYSKAKWCPEHRREGANLYTRRWHAENQDRDLAWRQANSERTAERRRAWMDANREKVRKWTLDRRARLRKATPFEFEADAIAARRTYYGNKCWMCGSSEGFEIDHVKPLAAGGLHIPANMRPACKSCNSRKRDAWPLSKVFERIGASQ